MNLVEKLLKADTKKADELETKVIKSNRLAKILGESEPVEVTIREIAGKRKTEISAHQFDRKGKLDFSKVFDTSALLLTEAVTEPDVKNQDLQKHFGCSSPKDLVIKLFGNEVLRFGEEAAALGGLDSEEELEEEIKN